MTIADFLYQAGFWQWVGILCLAALLASGASKFRLWGSITKTKNKYINTKDKP